MDTGALSQDVARPVLKFNIHRHLLPKLRLSGPTHPLLHFNLPVLLLEHARSVSEQRHFVNQVFCRLFVFHSARPSANSVKPVLLVFLSLPKRMLAQYLQKCHGRFLVRLASFHCSCPL